MVWDYFDAISQTFNQDIRIGVFECMKQMGEFYRDQRLDLKECRVLLAGFSGDQPKIYSWHIEKIDPDGGDARPWGAIGCGCDVALHFPRNCQPLGELNQEQLSALVYFSISEIAKSDLRVGKPIDLGVVRPSSAAICKRDSLGMYEEKSERLSRIIRDNL
jgi:hypothetical protein